MVKSLSPVDIDLTNRTSIFLTKEYVMMCFMVSYLTHLHSFFYPNLHTLLSFFFAHLEACQNLILAEKKQLETLKKAEVVRTENDKLAVEKESLLQKVKE